MNRTENNKLIVEFMGVKFDKGTLYNMGYDVFSDGNLYRKHELKYHAEWNWLIPVVQKIQNTGRFLSIQDDIDFALTCGLRKQSLYEVVLKFIKKYNEKKNKTI